MHDKADDVVGDAVNKPTDVLFTDMACVLITVPLTTRKHICRRELPLAPLSLQLDTHACDGELRGSF